jgi:hypothetical protein
MKYKNHILTIAISIVVSLVVLELASFAYLSLVKASFAYGRALPVSSQRDNDEQSPVTRERISPYLGYARPPDTPLAKLIEPSRLPAMASPATSPAWLGSKTNNHGFLSSYDYPVAKNGRDDFIIGIFGGSVAQWFALQGEHTLTARLRQGPHLNGRNIKVLNFASGSYKQPQQLIALAYYMSIGQQFDFVINIDGFNELALAEFNRKKGLAPYMPSSEVMLNLASLANISRDQSTLLETASLIKSRNAIKESSISQDHCRIALCFVWHEVAGGFYSRRYQAQLEKSKVLSSQSLLQLHPWETATTNSIASYVSVWRNSTETMAHLLGSKKIRYLHVIQPNQYVGRHVFQIEEHRLALNKNSPYREIVVEAYPHLRAEAAKLRDAHFPILDATAVFDNMDTWVFSDDCCHYNQTGNDLLAVAVANAMRQLLKEGE